MPLQGWLSSASQGRLELYDDGAAGRAVRARDATPVGGWLCSADSLAIALEPHCRDLRCGFCTAVLADPDESCCKACGVIAICRGCRSAGAAKAHAAAELPRRARRRRR